MRADLKSLMEALRIAPNEGANAAQMTELIKCVNEVFAERDLLKAIFDSFPGPISWVTAGLEYIGVNQTLADVIGIDPVEFSGKAVGFVTDDSAFSRFIRDFFASGAPTDHQVIEVVLRDRTTVRWYSMVATKYDRNTKAVIAGVDVTELKHAQSLIAGLQSQSTAVSRLASLGEVAAGMTHEINNPMTVIAGAASELRDAIQTEPLQKELALELLSMVEAASTHITTIVDGVRHLARDDGSDAVFVKANAKSLVDEAFVLCRAKIRQSRVSFAVDVDERLEFQCIPSGILQVLINLIGNACDAIDAQEERWIRVEGIEQRGHAILSVTDSGPGIPKDLAKKVMQPFFTTKAPGKGTGIGLSISKGILERHGGRLYLDSAAVHTRLVLDFPLRQDKAQARARSVA